MESPHKIFLIPEVLEQVLVELDATTLLLSQRVCHLWNSLIKTSPTLQRALFFRPEKQPPTEDQNPKRTTNPFLDKLLKHFVSNPTSVNGTQDSSNWLCLFMPQQTTNHQRLGRKQHPYSRPEASWREMLLDQPPTPSIAVRDDLMPLRTFGVLCDERKSVLRLKHLETLVQDARSYYTEKRSPPSLIELYNDIRLGDQPIQKIQKAEREYFRGNTSQEAIARKPTPVSQWGCQHTPPHQQRLRKAGELLVTDSKLWKWIMLFKFEWDRTHGYKPVSER
ncbi:hypothetical protein AtubIFM56815_008617 [Aspergillus tubingensis]|uniref:Uncharacterized protein n=1 Tax=Aspergillus tubingensis TaxID=5068 RepID=A0A8H3SKA0_ASPTU|nr:acyl-CoA dehydrogenase, C-terminal domain family protein [Aspergillus tubingensis]GFN11051.1 acyl-CoA dehydrogenase, C-terminal domain family protein [Aspergillus tubingensis]GLA58297.1 hypothetical protein AtubIFM54640_007443 [Aspergillus tubingensis]GLA84404.1 hypothetical protein AtubIFM56815_008617 [Aspergillus tubingensis]